MGQEERVYQGAYLRLFGRVATQIERLEQLEAEILRLEFIPARLLCGVTETKEALIAAEREAEDMVIALPDRAAR